MGLASTLYVLACGAAGVFVMWDEWSGTHWVIRAALALFGLALGLGLGTAQASVACAVVDRLATRR